MLDPPPEPATAPRRHTRCFLDLSFLCLLDLLVCGDPGFGSCPASSPFDFPIFPVIQKGLIFLTGWHSNEARSNGNKIVAHIDAYCTGSFI